MPPKTRAQGVQSIEVGMRLLACLTAAKGPMKLRDLAAAARMPAAKAHRYLVSLIDAQVIEQHGETGLYDLGAQSLNIGLSALGRLQPLSVAQPYLNELHDDIGQTVALAIWANHGATIVAWIGAESPVAASLRVGSVMPLTRSATGQVFLAFLPESKTHGLLRRELTENAALGLSPKSTAQAHTLRSAIQAQGFARTSDFIPGISGCAMPVFDYTDTLALAIVTLGYAGAIDLSEGSTIMQRLMLSAKALSTRLGRPTS